MNREIHVALSNARASYEHLRDDSMEVSYVNAVEAAIKRMFATDDAVAYGELLAHIDWPTNTLFVTTSTLGLSEALALKLALESVATALRDAGIDYKYDPSRREGTFGLTVPRDLRMR